MRNIESQTDERRRDKGNRTDRKTYGAVALLLNGDRQQTRSFLGTKTTTLFLR